MFHNRFLFALIIALCSVFLFGAGTFAYFFDVERSLENLFQAGTLDLKVDESDKNVIKFSILNFAPGQSISGVWVLSNKGSVLGYLDLENITLSGTGGIFTEPEREAGDLSNKGDLESLVTLQLFFDRDGDKIFSASVDRLIYYGCCGGIAERYDLNEPIAPGGHIDLVAIFYWPSHGYLDNLGQGDTLQFSLIFTLSQKP